MNCTHPPPRTFTPAPPPLTPKSARTRALLLATSADLFTERGYEAVSMQDIADAAELTKGALYGHFRSRAQLLIEVVRWKLAQLDERSDFEELNLEDGIQMLGAPQRRDLRRLEVDAAAAARYDGEVAAGLAELQQERHLLIRRTAEDFPDPRAAAWFIAVIEAGIGMSDAAGVPTPDRDRVEATLVAALMGVYRGLGPEAARPSEHG